MEQRVLPEERCNTIRFNNEFEGSYCFSRAARNEKAHFFQLIDFEQRNVEICMTINKAGKSSDDDILTIQKAMQGNQAMMIN